MFIRLGDTYVAVRHITTIEMKEDTAKIWTVDTHPDRPILCSNEDIEVLRGFLKIREQTGMITD